MKNDLEPGPAGLICSQIRGGKVFPIRAIREIRGFSLPEFGLEHRKDAFRRTTNRSMEVDENMRICGTHPFPFQTFCVGNETRNLVSCQF